MNTKTYALLLALTLPLAPAALAETVTETTIVTSKPMPHVERIDFMAFDMNRDTRLSMREVGDVLFDAFDGDKNGKLDSMEFEKNTVITVMPRSSTTYTYYDYNNDGLAEASKITQTEFMERSNLIRFDRQENGLSAHEFIGKYHKELDVNRDNYVTKEEWQREYSLFVKPKVNMNIYNK
ncbi:MAG: hypothetical protein V4621_03095 [Pseudomonadota bacterium]